MIDAAARSLIDAGIQLIVCITEGIPIMDMLKVRRVLAGKECYLIGLILRELSRLVKLKPALSQEDYCTW